MTSLQVNGSAIDLDVDPGRRLSAVLREDLGLTGTKVGCDAGDCGACAVLVDGMLINSCTMPVGRMGGRSIETIEGAAVSGALSALQRSFLHHGAAQCGICTPGFLIAAKSLLEHNDKPTESEIRYALAGNLCRCTGYDKIVRAVSAAAGDMRRQKKAGGSK